MLRQPDGYPRLNLSRAVFCRSYAAEERGQLFVHNGRNVCAYRRVVRDTDPIIKKIKQAFFVFFGKFRLDSGLFVKENTFVDSVDRGWYTEVPMAANY